MSTAAIQAAMRTRFCAPEYALMFEVGDGTGAAQRRWADAVSMNMYPSRGLLIEGFEFKASRSDWQRELKDPTKSWNVQQYCERWWIVTLPGIIKDGELPPTWGLMLLENGKLRQAVAAPKLDATPPTKTFMAAMLRRASEADESVVSEIVSAKVERIRANNEKRIDAQVQARTRAATELMAKVDSIREKTGIDISSHGFDDELFVRAVRLLMDSGVQATYSGLASLQSVLARASLALNSAIEEFNRPEPTIPEAQETAMRRRKGSLAVTPPVAVKETV